MDGSVRLFLKRGFVWEFTHEIGIYLFLPSTIADLFKRLWENGVIGEYRKALWPNPQQLPHMADWDCAVTSIGDRMDLAPTPLAPTITFRCDHEAVWLMHSWRSEEFSNSFTGSLFSGRTSARCVEYHRGGMPRWQNMFLKKYLFINLWLVVRRAINVNRWFYPFLNCTHFSRRIH